MDPKDPIPGCPHFTIKDALWLPELNRLATSEECPQEHFDNLIETFKWMEIVRSWINKPISVHLAYRTMQYHLDLYKRINDKRVAEGKPEVKVPTASAHLSGNAVDFHVIGMSCDDFKQKVIDENKLEEWNLRMENNGAGASWIHLDSKPPRASGRFFNP